MKRRSRVAVTAVLGIIGFAAIIVVSVSPTILNRRLMTATRKHDYKRAELMLRLGADANALYPSNVSSGSFYARLLRFFGKPLPVHITGRRPLVEAMSLPADLPLTRLLLAHGADANARDGNVPLRLAVSSGSLPLVTLLLAHGADANGGAGDYRTPLRLAIFSHSLPLVKLLLQHGADPDGPCPGPGNEDITPMQAALQDAGNRPANIVEIVKLLLNHGAQARPPVYSGQKFDDEVNLGEAGASDYIGWALVNDALDDRTAGQFVALMVQHGARLTGADLLSALCRHTDTLAREVLRKGAPCPDISEVREAWRYLRCSKAQELLRGVGLRCKTDNDTFEGLKPSHDYSSNPPWSGYLDLAFVRFLFIIGANPNAVTVNHQTILMEVVKEKNSYRAALPVMVALIRRGARVNARDGHGHTALYYANYNGYSDEAALLRKRGGRY